MCSPPCIPLRTPGLTRAGLQALLIHEFTATLGGIADGAEDWLAGSFAEFLLRHPLDSVNPMAHVAWDVLYRLHAAVDDVHLCADTWCAQPAGADITLTHMFFNGAAFSQLDLDAYWRGLANTPARALGPHMSDALRDVQAPAGPGGANVTVFDLAAYDLQRMADLGVGTINDVRAIYHLAPLQQWADLTTDPYTLAKLQAVYASVQEVDAFSGALAEAPVRLPLIDVQAAFGASIFRTIGYQALTYSMTDRFFYLRPGWLSAAELADVQASRLSDVIIRNTNITCMPMHSTFYRRDTQTTGPAC